MTQRAKSDRWNLIQEIFQNVVERPESERSNYVKKACGGNEGLRSEVESLLASESEGNTVQNLIAGDIKDLEQPASSSSTSAAKAPTESSSQKMIAPATSYVCRAMCPRCFVIARSNSA
jgi:hypothetical protein